MEPRDHKLFFKQLAEELKSKGGFPEVDMYVSEAQFGFEQIQDYLPAQGRVLEIGSGTSLLCYYLATLGYEIHAIEPIDIGFENSRPYYEEIQSRAAKLPNLEFHNTLIENFSHNMEFDFIYSINVFEHISNLEDSFSTLKKCLAPSGVAMLSLPNYHVPYESHFSIPILINKDFTFKMFGHRIKQFEERTRRHGMWESLNFITSSKLIDLARRNELSVRMNKTLVEKMFMRAKNEQEFLGRHGGISLIIKFILFFRLHKIFQFLPSFMLPYYSVRLTRSVGN